jgi:hypothetical protein
MLILLGLLVDAFLLSVLFGPAHLTFDLKEHEEKHCIEFNIPKQNWIYNYTDNSFGICSKAVGGIVEGCAISDGQTCTIFLPKSYEGLNERSKNLGIEIDCC